jgi:hypothetical protein
MLVAVPAGAGPGTQLTVATPTREQMIVQCPDGVVAGQQMQVNLADPAAAPPLVVMADSVPVAAPAPAPILVAASVEAFAADPSCPALKVEQTPEPSPSLYPSSPPQAMVAGNGEQTASPTPQPQPEPEPAPSPAQPQPEPEPEPAPSPAVVAPNELYTWLQASRLEQYATP